MRPRSRLVLGVLAFVPLACTSTTNKLRARFAHEHACSEDEVHVVASGGAAYQASGCGESAEYVCPSFASAGDDARSCEERGASKKPGGDVPPIPGPLDKPQPPGPKE
jgi:hypothetical protein